MATSNETMTGSTTAYDVPLWQMTQGEFQAMLNCVIESKVSALVQQVLDAQKSETEYAYGLKGICKIFGCGINKASEIKQSGIIDEAIMQCGRKMMIDIKKAIACYQDYQNKQQQKKKIWTRSR